jgi:MmyB-like transcription regulator ligand binding domain
MRGVSARDAKAAAYVADRPCVSQTACSPQPGLRPCVLSNRWTILAFCARKVVELVLRGHEPSPALAVYRHWNIVIQNNAVSILLEGVADPLLQRPVNGVRLSLHPEGMAPRIEL